MEKPYPCMQSGGQSHDSHYVFRKLSVAALLLVARVCQETQFLDIPLLVVISGSTRIMKQLNIKRASKLTLYRVQKPHSVTASECTLHWEGVWTRF